MPFRAKLAKRLAIAHLAIVTALTACGGGDDALSGPSAVIRIVVSPGSLNIGPNQTVRFAAYGETSARDSVGVTVTWAASGGAINDQGLYTANADGSYDVIATDRVGHQAAARVTVGAGLSSGAQVASIEVTPLSATVAPGSTQPLVAILRDAAGKVISGRLISWSSSKAGVAVVDGSGLVRGVSAGSAVIAATSETKTASVVVTVAPVGAAECANRRAEWIWCDDFEQDRLASYFEYDNAGGNFQRSNGVGYQGSTAMRGHWNPGSTSAGSLHLGIGKTPAANFRPVDAGTAKYREVYWRMYVKNQAGWKGGGGDKMSRAFVFASSNWTQAAIGHVWSGTSPSPDVDYLMIDPATGTNGGSSVITNGYNDFAHLGWLGSARGNLPMFNAAHVGQWYCVEAHMRLNNPGATDGVLEVWVDGSLQAQRTGLNYLGSYSEYGINAIYFENYWNAGSVASQDRFFDNIVVSTARIGCPS